MVSVLMKEKSVLGFHSKCDVTTYRHMCLWSSRMKEAGHGKQPLRVELDLQSFLCFLPTSFFMCFRHRNILTSLLSRNSSDKNHRPTYETMSLKRSFSKVHIWVIDILKVTNISTFQAGLRTCPQTTP